LYDAFDTFGVESSRRNKDDVISDDGDDDDDYSKTPPRRRHRVTGNRPTRPLGDMAQPSTGGGGGALWAGWDTGQGDDGLAAGSSPSSSPFNAEHPMKKYRRRRKKKKKKKNGSRRSGRRSGTNRNRRERGRTLETTTATTAATTAATSSNPVRLCFINCHKIVTIVRIVTRSNNVICDLEAMVRVLNSFTVGVDYNFYSVISPTMTKLCHIKWFCDDSD